MGAKEPSSMLNRLDVLNISSTEESPEEAQKSADEILENSRDEEKLPCLNNGKEYQPGSALQMEFGECMCINGQWECNEGPSLCSVWGDHYVETFDEKLITPKNGSCTYKLAADCSESQEFAIYSDESYLCSEKEKRKVRFLRIEFNGNYIRIGPNAIYVNEHEVMNKYSNDVTRVYIDDLKEEGYNIKIAQIGTIHWDKELQFDLFINSKYERDTCGVCGNNNGNPEDDDDYHQFVEQCKEDEGCIKPDDFKLRQIYDKTCLDLQKVSFPEFYNDRCANLKGALIKACLTCEKDIVEECMHMTNVECIKKHQKKCVGIEMNHYFKTCFALVFGGVSRRDVRALKVKEAIQQVDIWGMTIDDINTKLSDPELWR